MIAVIDNYDSFVFNIARYLRQLGAEPQVFRNDAISVSELAALKPEAILLSPGPGTPDDAGISVEVIRRLSGRVPILGICLGHQCIGQAFGGTIARARRPMHGQASQIVHDGLDLFDKIPARFEAGRYHSLIVEFDQSSGSPLNVTAHSEENEIMAVSHRAWPTYGVQFHPESILTEHGHLLFANFLQSAQRWHSQNFPDV